MSPFSMPSPAETASKLVLVVDDETLVRELAVDALSLAGYQVLSAASGGEALDVAKDAAIDVLFTDIQMPGEPDGVQLARRLRELLPSVAVVVSSGRVSPPASELPTGALFLPKPWGVEEIIRSVGSLCAPSQRPGLAC